MVTRTSLGVFAERRAVREDPCSAQFRLTNIADKMNAIRLLSNSRACGGVWAVSLTILGSPPLDRTGAQRASFPQGDALALQSRDTHESIAKWDGKRVESMVRVLPYSPGQYT